MIFMNQRQNAALVVTATSKCFFQYLVVDRHLSFMDAYEVVGYHFYISADHVQKILRTINKSRQNAEWYLTK